MEFVPLREIYATHYILQSDALHSLKFPLIFPVRPLDTVHFITWLHRWKHTFSGLDSISINYLHDKYRSSLFELLGTMNLQKLKHIDIVNILGLFDSLSPRLLFGVRSFYSKCTRARYIKVDARILRFCSSLPHAHFTTYSTIGSRTLCYPNNNTMVVDTRKTCLNWIHNFDSHVNIKCWCFQSNGICETEQRMIQKRKNIVMVFH